MNTTKKNVGRVVGPLGILLILFALFTRIAITGEFDVLVGAQLGLGVLGIGVFVATALDDVRNIATGRGAVFVLTSAITTLAFVAGLVAVNYAVVRKNKEWDLTKNGVHTLADQTIQALQSIPADRIVSVTAFYRPIDPEYGAVEDLLKRYKAVAGASLEYEFVDLYKNPARAKAMAVTPGSPRVILKAADGKEARAKENTEEALTNALLELWRGVEKQVYFLTAHGEKSAEKGADQALGLKLWVDGLRNEGWKSAELNLLARKEVPSDALAVVVAGPQSPLSSGEAAALSRYAEQGGRLIVLQDPAAESGLESVMEAWGVKMGKGMVVDPQSQEPLWALTQEFSEHPIATPRMTVMGALAFVFPEARSVSAGQASGYTLTELFKTGPEAWGENDPFNPAAGTSVERGESDDAGPLPLGVAVSKKLDGDKEFRAVVLGDSDFATNAFIRQGGNRDLALNAVQWLGGDEKKITIRPKLREKSTLAFMTQKQRLFLSFGSLNVLPLLMIAIGLSIHQLRKSR